MITAKDYHLFLSAKSGLRALNNVSEMVPISQEAYEHKMRQITQGL